MCFRQNAEVITHLEKLRHHPNELIRKAIGTELDGKRGSQQEKRDHVHSPEWLHNVLVNADVLDALRYVPDESVHLTFTSPPCYYARDYTIYRSYEEYCSFWFACLPRCTVSPKKGVCSC